MELVIDPKGQVWKDNPHLEVVKVFADFKEKYGEKKSDLILKGIYYIYDVRSPLRDSYLKEEERIENINATLLKEDFDWDEVSKVVKTYEELVPSKAQAELKRFKDEVTGLNDFLEDWPWCEENVKDKTKVLIDSEKIWNIYLTLKDKVEAESAESDSRGGYSKSKIEKMRNK